MHCYNAMVLSHGVMVTLQILVLSFKVRILVAQQSQLIVKRLHDKKAGTVSRRFLLFYRSFI